MKLGDCYKAACDALIHGSDPIDRWLNVRLVHGCPVNTGDHAGKQMGHAWVEGEVKITDTMTVTFVFDAASGNVFPAAAFYAVGKIDFDECVFYDYDAALDCMVEFEHYGPWAPLPSGVL